jgi:type IV pilus assembly protein PilB
MFVSSGDQELDVRVSFYVSIHGETAVLRILSRRQGVLEVPNLGFAPLILRRYVEDVLECETGIVILTGPTGSGKTTTLSSSISALNHIDTKIITAEDPVEYQIDGVTQCQINPQIGLTYEETLRAIVRQDPDVIVLGEVRDEFSGGVAVQAALTGHKVFTTLHTEDSVGALLRLINMNIKPFFVASTVQGVVAQRLVRRICQKCGQPYSPSRDEIRRSGLSARDVRRYEFKRGVGCDHCSFSGYRGRIGFFELLTPNDQTRDQLMTTPTSSSLREVALRTAGLVSLREDGLAKAALGWTTLEEVYRHTPRVENVRDMGTVLSLLGY